MTRSEPDSPSSWSAPAPPDERDAAEGREFSAMSAAFFIAASMVGVGILTTSGYTIASVGSNQVMLWLWIVGGVAMLCGALTHAELAAAMPRIGGDYVFVREAYGRLAGFLAGWITALIGFGAPIAVTARTSASYWLTGGGLVAPEALTKEYWWAERALATGLILGLAGFHLLGRRGSARLQGLTTLATLGALVAMVVFGLISPQADWSHLDDLPDQLTGSVWSAMLISLLYINYGYAGWNSAGYLAGEVKNPGRNLPRAIVLGNLAVLSLYVAVNLVYIVAFSAEEIQTLASSNPNAVKNIAELAVARLIGPPVSTWFALFVAVLLLSMLSAFLVTGPRVIVAMAREGMFPRFAARVSQRGAPVPATLCLALFAVALNWIPRFASVLEYASLGLALASLSSVSAIYVLRRTRPHLPRPYRTWGYPVTPAVFLVVTVALAIAAVRDRPEVAFWTLATLLAGTVAFVFVNR